MESSLHYTSVNHADGLIGSINQLRRRKELCDVVLCIGDRRIPVHKLILSACMPYFHNLLDSGHSRVAPVEYCLKDTDPDAAQSIIDFCYTSAISVTEENVLTLLPTAFMFQMEEISTLCCDFLLSQIRSDTCFVTYQVASQCECQSLQEASMAFILEHFQTILEEENFLEQSVYTLLQTLRTLQSDGLSDEQVVDAIRCWVDHCIEDRQQSAQLVANFFPELLEQFKEFLPSELLQTPFREDDMDTSCRESLSSNTPIPDDSPTHCPTILCTVCNEIFTDQQALDRHFQDCEDLVTKPELLHIDISQEKHSLSLSTGMTSNGNGLSSSSHFAALLNSKTCPICNKNFTDLHSLSKHIKLHSDNGYSCSSCQRKYSSESNLEGHMRVHSSDRPFLCDFCGKNFSSFCILMIHRMSHSGEKPFPCPTCGMGFAKNIHLKRHMQIHTGAKPHVCNICGKHFSRSDHVKRHIQSIHSGAKPHTCTLCRKDFVRKYELNKHMKLHFSHGIDGMTGTPEFALHEFENGSSNVSESSTQD